MIGNCFASFKSCLFGMGMWMIQVDFPDVHGRGEV